jgi:hypothetical protein
MSYASNLSNAYNGEAAKLITCQFKLHGTRCGCVQRPSAKRSRRLKLQRYWDLAELGPVTARGMY